MWTDLIYKSPSCGTCCLYCVAKKVGDIALEICEMWWCGESSNKSYFPVSILNFTAIQAIWLGWTNSHSPYYTLLQIAVWWCLLRRIEWNLIEFLYTDADVCIVKFQSKYFDELKRKAWKKFEFQKLKHSLWNNGIHVAFFLFRIQQFYDHLPSFTIFFVLF